jgi:transcriptional regulator with XRE-family HTH domain
MDDKAIVLLRFGATVRVRRYQLGLSQLSLAERIGCSLQAIGDIERGVANPSLWMVFRIAKALDVYAKDLVSF